MYICFTHKKNRCLLVMAEFEISHLGNISQGKGNYLTTVEQHVGSTFFYGHHIKNLAKIKRIKYVSSICAQGELLAKVLRNWIL
jgi:hypothetical protein